MFDMTAVNVINHPLQLTFNITSIHADTDINVFIPWVTTSLWYPTKSRHVVSELYHIHVLCASVGHFVIII